MLSAFLPLSLIFLVISAPVSGLPVVTRRGDHNQPRQEPVKLHTLATVTEGFPGIGVLVEGNQRFRDSIANSSNPNLLKEQTEKGQSPGFLFLGCRCVPPM